MGPTWPTRSARSLDVGLVAVGVECDMAWTVIGQAASGIRDADLLRVVGRCEGETAGQLAWLRTPIKQAAP